MIGLEKIQIVAWMIIRILQIVFLGSNSEEVWFVTPGTSCHPLATASAQIPLMSDKYLFVFGVRQHLPHNAKHFLVYWVQFSVWLKRIRTEII